MKSTYPFFNQPLPYSFDALEPYIDEKTMELHHDRHLQTYIDQLNDVLKNYPAFHSWTTEQLLLNINSLPPSIQTPVARNAGGVFNHAFYFANLTPKPQSITVGSLVTALSDFYGTFYTFKQEMKKAALSVFGSGYSWLTLNVLGQFEIIALPNQETPLPLQLYPLLNLDVWEHAYYLKHANQRASYIDCWFEVVNWKQAELNYQNVFRHP